MTPWPACWTPPPIGSSPSATSRDDPRLDPGSNVAVHSLALRNHRPLPRDEVHRRMSVFCTRCGHRNPDDAHFCANCGAPLREDTTVSFTPIEVEEEGADETGLPQSELE